METFDLGHPINKNSRAHGKYGGSDHPTNAVLSEISFVFLDQADGRSIEHSKRRALEGGGCDSAYYIEPKSALVSGRVDSGHCRVLRTMIRRVNKGHGAPHLALTDKADRVACVVDQ